MKNVIKLFTIACFLSAGLTGCISIGEGDGDMAKRQLVLHTKTGTHTFNVEVADTRELREKGLMGRESLAEDAGMWFVYDREHFPAFWMKNMKISLDMIFLDKNMKIVDVFSNVLPCKSDPCDHYIPATKSQYIVELNAGKAKEMKVLYGDIAELK